MRLPKQLTSMLERFGYPMEKEAGPRSFGMPPRRTSQPGPKSFDGEYNKIQAGLSQAAANPNSAQSQKYMEGFTAAPGSIHEIRNKVWVDSSRKNDEIQYAAAQRQHQRDLERHQGYAQRGQAYKDGYGYNKPAPTPPPSFQPSVPQAYAAAAASPTTYGNQPPVPRAQPVGPTQSAQQVASTAPSAQTMTRPDGSTFQYTPGVPTPTAAPTQAAAPAPTPGQPEVPFHVSPTTGKAFRSDGSTIVGYTPPGATPPAAPPQPTAPPSAATAATTTPTQATEPVLPTQPEPLKPQTEPGIPVGGIGAGVGVKKIASDNRPSLYVSGSDVGNTWIAFELVKKSMSAEAGAGIAGAGLGGLAGALIARARGKSMLTGGLAGAAVGGGLGVGAGHMMSSPDDVVTKANPEYKEPYQGKPFVAKGRPAFDESQALKDPAKTRLIDDPAGPLYRDDNKKLHNKTIEPSVPVASPTVEKPTTPPNNEDPKAEDKPVAGNEVKEIPAPIPKELGTGIPSVNELATMLGGQPKEVKEAMSQLSKRLLIEGKVPPVDVRAAIADLLRNPVELSKFIKGQLESKP